MRGNIFHSLVVASKAAFPGKRTGVVEVVGLLSEPNGLGEAARLTAESLEVSTCYQIRRIDVRKRGHNLDPGDAFFERPQFRIFQLNPPSMPFGVAAVGILGFSKCFNIGFWTWESTILPIEWRNSLRYMNAIFVPSHFTQKTVQVYTDKPVIVVAHPVNLVTPEANVRGRLAIDRSVFLVSVIFHLGSSFARKNPLGAVRAFKNAFSPGDNVLLVMKTLGGRSHAEEFELLQSEIGDDARIIVVDELWPAERVAGLISESNIFLSLHRAEGFGLSIAEAILREIPIVATGWSGNLDYCDSESTFLVRSSLTAVSDSGHPEFSQINKAEGALWAEPDIIHAAEHLRQIHENYELAKAKSLTARVYAERVLHKYSYTRAFQILASQVAK